MNQRTIAVWVRGSVAIAAVFALAACGKKDNSPAASDTTAMAAPAPTTAAAGSAATSATAAPSGGTAAPVTGKTVDVKMIGDAKGYRFEPSKLTVKVGDGVRFTNVTGGPHDVSFWADSIPAGAATQLQANMPNTMQPLVG
ncbi:MAG: plastocyanin/azurin family copper-binding protein, partial [Gemmatimonadaceae bacterium]